MIRKREKPIDHGIAGAAMRTCLKDLKDAADKVAQAISHGDRNRPAVAFCLANAKGPKEGVVEIEALDGESAREKAAQMLKDFHFRPGDVITEAKRLPGVLACSRKTLMLVNDLNKAKRALYDEIQLIDAGGRQPIDERPSPAQQKKKPKRFKQLRQDLISDIDPSLHLKQCYRQLNVLERRPNLVSFTWARNVKARKGLDVPGVKELLEQRLERCDTEGDPIGCRMWVTRELERLRGFSPETKFVLSRPIAPHLRVNLRFDVPPYSGMDFASLPLCYEDDARGLPAVIPPAPLRPETRARAKRRDARLGKAVFPAVHVYLPPE